MTGICGRIWPRWHKPTAPPPTPACAARCSGWKPRPRARRPPAWWKWTKIHGAPRARNQALRESLIEVQVRIAGDRSFRKWNTQANAYLKAMAVVDEAGAPKSGVGSVPESSVTCRYATFALAKSP